MAYEIPQQLQHKEKIILGLDLTQLLISLPFVFVEITLLSLSLNWYYLAILSLPIIGLAVFFIYFNGINWVETLFLFIYKRLYIIDSIEMKKLLEIEKIKDNIIITKDKIAILEILPINFQIKHDDERISDDEKTDVAQKSQNLISTYLRGTYINVEKYDGKVVCSGDVIASTLCTISSQNPNSKELYSISNEDSSIIVDIDGNIVFLSSKNGKAFEYTGYVGGFTDVHEAHKIAVKKSGTRKPLKISFIGVQGQDEMRLLYVFYNSEALKIIDAKTGGLVI